MGHSTSSRKSGRIRILDTDIGAWGHVAVDDIRFRTIPGYSGALTEQVAQETTLRSKRPSSGCGTERRRDRRSRASTESLVDRTARPHGRSRCRRGPRRSDRSKWRDSTHTRTPDHPLDSGWLGGPFKGTLRSDAFTSTMTGSWSHGAGDDSTVRGRIRWISSTRCCSRG